MITLMNYFTELFCWTPTAPTDRYQSVLLVGSSPKISLFKKLHILKLENL